MKGTTQRKLSDSAGPTEEKAEGYFSTLGLQFGCSIRDVQKAFRTLALQCHPDKAGTDKVLISRFQSASTAYHVLVNEASHAAYMHMYRIRCHLHQRPHEEGQPLAPFYLLQVTKKDYVGLEHQRVLTLDLLEGHLQNWKKDAPHKQTPLNHITEVKTTGPTSFTISFSGEGERLYKLSATSPRDAELYVSVLRAIAGGTRMPTDDANFPPSSIRKGFVEKAGKSGDWARRWLILGSTNILIFRNSDCEKMVNAIPLDGKTCSVKIAADGAWTLTAMGRKWSFRNSKPSIAHAWVNALDKALKAAPEDVENWLDQRRSLLERRRRPTGPALIRTEDDLKAKNELASAEGGEQVVEDEQLEQQSTGERGSLIVLDDEEEIEGGRAAALSTVAPLPSSSAANAPGAEGGAAFEGDSSGPLLSLSSAEATPLSARLSGMTAGPRASLNQMVTTFNGLFRKEGPLTARGKGKAVTFGDVAAGGVADASSAAGTEDADVAEAPGPAAAAAEGGALSDGAPAAAPVAEPAAAPVAEPALPAAAAGLLPTPPPPPAAALGRDTSTVTTSSKDKKAPHSPSIDADFMARTVAGQLANGGMVRTFL